jgi:hypothetical protein
MTESDADEARNGNAQEAIDHLPNNSPKNETGIEDHGQLENDLQNKSAAELLNNMKREISLHDQPKSPICVSRANIPGNATNAATGITFGDANSDTISEGEKMAIEAVRLQAVNEREVSTFEAILLDKETNEEDCIEIIDSSDSEEENGEDVKFSPTLNHNHNKKDCNTKDDTIIVDDDDDESSEDELEIVEDLDDKDVAFVTPCASDEARKDRDRKRKEARRLEVTKFHVERKILEARRRRAKSLMEMNKKKVKSPISTLPNFTFYTAPPTRKERPQQSQQPIQKSQKPRPSSKFDYMDDSAAFHEQERLLRESATRVRAQDISQRRMNISRGDGVQFYTEPVKDLSTLPKDHFQWSNLYSRLGVPQRSRFNIVKKNYRKLCLLYHPDKAGCNDKEAQDRFQAIKEAYETISESQEM